MNHPEYPAAVLACGEGWLEYHKYTLTDTMGEKPPIMGYGYRTADGVNVIPAQWPELLYYVYRDDCFWQGARGIPFPLPRYEPGWDNLTPDEKENLARVEEHKHRQQNPLLAFIEDQHGKE